MTELMIKDIEETEIDRVAKLMAKGYYDDIFFRWVVPDDDVRMGIVTNYYQIYLTAKGCITHVAKDCAGEIVGAAVWLPHDVDARIYDDIDVIGGKYAKNFRAVADKSHDSEPPMSPFYQLVGIVVAESAQGKGVGKELLRHQLELLDAKGIPTYLEASTAYDGQGVYGKFGYQPIGELLWFEDTAVLYPLWRPARLPKAKVQFGSYSWLVLEDQGDKQLLLAEHVLELLPYHDTYEAVTWEESSIRKYLNTTFYERFTYEEQNRMIGGLDRVTIPCVHLLMRYFGNSGQLMNPATKFYVDDQFNEDRKATDLAGDPCRWYLNSKPRGRTMEMVDVVMLDGRVAITGDFVNRVSSDNFKIGVRPSIWIKKETEL